jgi:uncharacterized membrane protein YdjX (TVP38/TMEM64 family)
MAAFVESRTVKAGFPSRQLKLIVFLLLMLVASIILSIVVPKLPRNLPDAIALSRRLVHSSQKHPIAIPVLWGLAYITLQTFAIPGTIMLSLISGSLFGSRKGVLFTSLVSTAGSCSAYLLSKHVGQLAFENSNSSSGIKTKSNITGIWSTYRNVFKKTVADTKHNHVWLVIFLRLTPLLPNTVINVLSPHFDIKLNIFALGTFVGCFPNNFAAVSAGARLGELKSLSDVWSVEMGIVTGIVAVAALLPFLINRRK